MRRLARPLAALADGAVRRGGLHGAGSWRGGGQDFRATLAEELDFVKEAQNAERCRRDLQSIRGVTVPRIRYDLSTERVLTAEFIHGCKGDDVAVRRACPWHGLTRGDRQAPCPDARLAARRGSGPGSWCTT